MNSHSDRVAALAEENAKLRARLAEIRSAFSLFKAKNMALWGRLLDYAGWWRNDQETKLAVLEEDDALQELEKVIRG